MANAAAGCSGPNVFLEYAPMTSFLFLTLIPYKLENSRCSIVCAKCDPVPVDELQCAMLIAMRQRHLVAETPSIIVLTYCQSDCYRTSTTVASSCRNSSVRNRMSSLSGVQCSQTFYLHCSTSAQLAV